MTTLQNSYVRRFSPSPPPPFRRIDFYCPPPIPKTVQKRALCKLYIYRKGEAFLAPFCVLFPSVEKRPRKVGGISSSPTKFLIPDPCVISSS